MQKLPENTIIAREKLTNYLDNMEAVGEKRFL